WLTVATDNDTNLAGQVAAERDYWVLAPHDLDPGHALLPAGLDPADVFTLRGPAALRTALLRPGALADTLLEERLTNLPPDRARIAAARIISSRPTRHWADGADQLSTRMHLSTTRAQRDLIPAADSWSADRRKAARTQIDKVSDVRARMQQAAALTPDQRWAGLAGELDPRLTHEADWPALAQLLDQAHDEGHNVPAVTRQLIADRPLAEQPALDLRYRLVATLDITIDTDGPVGTTSSTGAERQRRASTTSTDKPISPRRAL
ncbi:MAG: transfer protein Tra, partial [Actinomycetota bacterium]|nr:transfer protein Tra [Actinomycetota bacterium]